MVLSRGFFTMTAPTPALLMGSGDTAILVKLTARSSRLWPFCWLAMSFDFKLLILLWSMELEGERPANGDDLDFADRSSVSDAIDGFWFSFCDEFDSDDDEDRDEADDGEATNDMDRSSGLSIRANVHGL